MSETQEKNKQIKTRVAERLKKAKTLLHARVVVELGEVEALVDACLTELLPKPKGKKKP